MVSLQGFQIYRTENITINNTSYTVRFSLSNDGNEFVLFVSNNSNGKQSKYHFANDAADDWKYYNGKTLEDEVLKLIECDIKNSVI